MRVIAKCKIGKSNRTYAARFTHFVTFVNSKFRAKALLYMKKENKQKSKKAWIWPVIILILAFSISLGFGILSEISLSNATIIVAVIVIMVFVAISILFDMLGLAVATCQIEPFTAMSARKVKGSKQALSLIKNADKVGSICDVIGDVCGILSGAAGASIVAKIAFDNAGNFMAILIPSLVAAIIAGITIGGKAIFKRIAIKHADSITLSFAKFINFFTRKG